MLERFLNKHISEVINAAFDCSYSSDEEFTRFALSIVRGESDNNADLYNWVIAALEKGDFTVGNDFYKHLRNRDDLSLIARCYAAAAYDSAKCNHAKVVAISCGDVLVKGDLDYWVWRKVMTANGVTTSKFASTNQVSFSKDPALKGKLVPFLDGDCEESVITAFNYAPFTRFELGERRDKDGNPIYRLYHIVCKDDSGRTYVIAAPVTEIGFDPLNASIGSILEGHI